MRIRSASGVGRPKAKAPKVKTRFNKKGYASKFSSSQRKRLGAFR